MTKEEFINKISLDNKYTSICKRLTKNRDYEDLHQELILLFLEMKPEQIEKIEKPDAYIYKTILTLISKRGNFHKKYRTYICEEIKEKKEIEEFNNEEDLISVEEKLDGLYWCDREIVKVFLNKGTIRKTARALNIPLTSTKAIIDRAKKTIKHRMIKPKIMIMMQNNITALQYYRQYIPHERLAITYKDDFEFVYNRPQKEDEEPTIMWMTDEELKEYKAVLFLRQIAYTHELIQPTIDRLKSLGIKIIFDIDDFWELPKSHYWYEAYKKNNTSNSVTDTIKQVDYVTTTTGTFSDIIYKYNSNISVMPNCISEKDNQFKIRKIENKRIRFGWVGGVFHKSDIKLIEDGISKLYDSKELNNKWQLCLGGYNNSPEYNEIERIFTNNYDFKTTDSTYYNYLLNYTQNMEHISYDKQYRRLWGKSITTYGDMYNELDVCLIPLEDNKFNNCKSELKIIEAGTMRKAVIVSNVSPYKQWIKNGKNGILVDPSRNNIDWFVSIRKLILNPNMIEDMGMALNETIKNNFDLDEHNKRRAELYKKITS